jgi:hypothetical protein
VEAASSAPAHLDAQPSRPASHDPPYLFRRDSLGHLETRPLRLGVDGVATVTLLGRHGSFLQESRGNGGGHIVGTSFVIEMTERESKT